MKAVTSPTATAGIQVCVLVALLGALAGIALAAATDAVSRTTIGGPSWSLSGNGALVVLFAGVPAVLAGGWAALARWRLRHRRWGTAGIGVGIVALVAAALASFGPVIVVNMLGTDALEAVAITYVLPPVVAFVGGVGMALPMGLTRRGLLVAVALLVVVFALAVTNPFVLVPLGFLVALPLVAAGPMLFSRGRARLFGWGWLAAACVALVVGVIGGVIGAQQVQGL